MSNCPTCGRRPSERHASPDQASRLHACDDPIHDLADAGPELVEALRGLLQSAMSGDEARLCMVACNAPAMARGEEPAISLHKRCDAINSAQDAARTLLSRLEAKR